MRDRLREGAADPRRETRENARGTTRQRVAGPEVHGDAQRARREHDGDRDRAAGRECHPRAEPRDAEERVEVRERKPDERQQERDARVRVAKRSHRDRVKWDARLGHEATLAPATTTDEEESHLGIRRAQGLDDREERADMTARPAPDEEHATRSPARDRLRVQR